MKARGIRITRDLPAVPNSNVLPDCYERPGTRSLPRGIAFTYASSMVFRDLPPETQSCILELCSPSDLDVLSRVHTSVRDMAEYALYSRIQYRVRPSDLIIPSRNIENGESSQKLKEDGSLLHTFAINSRKASMVKITLMQIPITPT